LFRKNPRREGKRGTEAQILKHQYLTIGAEWLKAGWRSVESRELKGRRALRKKGGDEKEATCSARQNLPVQELETLCRDSETFLLHHGKDRLVQILDNGSYDIAFLQKDVERRSSSGVGRPDPLEKRTRDCA